MEIKSNKKDSFVINDKFQLEKHQTIKNNSTTNIPYKLVSVHGPFHKTIKRNIMFDKPLDSLKTLFFLFPDSISIRGYSLNETNQYDSTDITIYLTKK